MKTSAIAMVAAWVVAVVATGAQGAIRAVTPQAWDVDPDGWKMKRHVEKMGVVTNGGAKVVFIGDSITHGWEWEAAGKAVFEKYYSEGEYKAIDLGVSADRTEHVLWRLDNGDLDGYEAKCIVLMIGTNNTGRFPFADEPPVDTILGIRAILEKIRAKQPKATIVLLPIFPRGAGPDDPLRLRNDVVNREIQKFCDGKTTFWCDFTDQFLTPDGQLPRELFPDLLHPSAAGYEIWHSGIKPYIDYALSDGALPPPANRYASFVRPGSMRIGEARAEFPATRILNERWWLDRLLAKRNQIAASNGEFDIVLYGDSITHFWESRGKDCLNELSKTYSVLDIGYGGDCTEHLVWRGLNGELDGYKAKCVMLMIGTNNSDKDSPEDMAKGIRSILDIIAAKQPQAKTILLPIFPRGNGPADKHRVCNDKANMIINGFADGDKVIWLDFNSKFLDANGDTQWIMPDRLHPNADGYRIWLEATLPLIHKICGK